MRTVRHVDAVLVARTGLRLVDVAAIAAAWLTFALARFLTHPMGDPSGNPFVPDGAFYTFMALDWSGHSASEAARITSDFYRARYPTAGEPEFFVEQTKQTWLLVKPRLVYPALSVPFVAVFGIKGMLVVPWLASLFTVLVVAVIAARLVGRGPALAVVALLLVGRYLPWWFTANHTDPVVMAVSAAVVLVLLGGAGETWSPRRLALLAGLVLLGCFVRQTGPIWVAMVAGGYAWRTLQTRRLRNTWLAPAAVTAVVAGAATVFTLWWVGSPLTSQVATASASYEATPREALLGFPGTYWRVLTTEFLLRPVSSDAALFLLIVLGVVGAVVGRRSLLTALLIATVAGTVAVASVNGSITNFRYMLPVVPLLGVAAAVGARWIAGASPGRRAR